ncbi:MAG: sirohydrochlorin cobaltochelatase [Bacteroidaceae bacterium]|nr:sirohydrochlorin cobaltochelatase [Bacteroidaceae bacterium]MBQ9639980.1 sirohydrochlorin cobaltochelatase [Bacteroidaceae bacterium]
MNRFLSIVAFVLFPLCPLCAQNTEVEQDLFESMRNADKAVVVAVHYGVTDDSQRQLCIERFNSKLQAAFPQCAFREAWTSFPAVKQMKQRGQTKWTLNAVLDDLCMEGYTHVLVQSSNIVEGVEMEYIRHEAALYANKFKQLRIGNTLLAEPGSYQQAIQAIAASFGEKKVANVLVVGGEDSESPSQFAMLDYMLRSGGYANWFVVAEEGFPQAEELKKQLKAKKQKKVNLIPFTFAAEDHAQLNELEHELQKAGYKVTLTEHTLGEVDGILDLFIGHAKHAQRYRAYSPLEIKMQGALK